MKRNFSFFMVIIVIAIMFSACKGSSPKDVVAAMYDCFNNDDWKGFANCHVDDRRHINDMSSEEYEKGLKKVKQRKRMLGIKKVNYEIVKEEIQDDVDAYVYVKMWAEDFKDTKFGETSEKYHVVQYNEGEWLIGKKIYAHYTSAKYMVDMAMRYFVLGESFKFSDFFESWSDYRDVSKFYEKNPVEKYDIMGEEAQGEDKAVVEIKITHQNGKESIAKVDAGKDEDDDWKILSFHYTEDKANMVEDNDGEWKTKTSDEGNSGIQTSTITSDADGETQYDWLSTRYVTYDDIKNMDKGQVRVLKNAIFARHGRRFKDPNLRAYFNSQSWYTPTCDEVPPHEFNEYENYNIKFLLKYEK